MEFDLDEFLRNHQPAKIDFSEYFKLKKLKGYKLLEKNSEEGLKKLDGGYTYVKYIREGDAFGDGEYKDHVHCGGVFVAGGRYYNGVFKKMPRVKKWTHILIKRQPYSSGKEVTKKGYGMKSTYDYDIHIYTIKLGNNYIFYKYSKKLKEKEEKQKKQLRKIQETLE